MYTRLLMVLLTSVLYPAAISNSARGRRLKLPYPVVRSLRSPRPREILLPLTMIDAQSNVYSAATHTLCRKATGASSRTLSPAPSSLSSLLFRGCSLAAHSHLDIHCRSTLGALPRRLFRVVAPSNTRRPMMLPVPKFQICRRRRTQLLLIRWLKASPKLE